MTVLLEHLPVIEDERAARRDLRAQIARLEARGVTTPAAAARPRRRSVAERAAHRDAMLASRTSLIPAPVAGSATFAARRALEAMLADPSAHRRECISLAALGQPGCGAYRVKPRLGLIGMLAGWWQITLSSGCP
jgi:hypothetical protein